MSTESIHIVSDKGFEEKLVSLTVSVTNLAEVVEVHSDKWAAAIALCEQSAAAAADSAAASARDSANTAIEVAEIRQAVVDERPTTSVISGTTVAEKWLDFTVPDVVEPPVAVADEAAAAAKQMVDILEIAHTAASDLIGLLDEPSLPADPKAGDEEIRHGVAANQADDFVGAAEWFETSHHLKPRVATLLSIANMRLKLGEGPIAAHIYAAILEHPAASETEREIALRKLPLAEVQLEKLRQTLAPSAMKPPASRTLISSAAKPAAAPALTPATVNPKLSWLPLAEATLGGDNGGTLGGLGGDLGSGVGLGGMGDVIMSVSEVGLLGRVASLTMQIAAMQRDASEMIVASRAKDASLEQMLREVTQTMNAEMSRAAKQYEQVCAVVPWHRRRIPLAHLRRCRARSPHNSRAPSAAGCGR